MLRRAFLLPLLAACLAAVTAMATDPEPIDELVRSERAFSATSVEKGMRDAFVEFLADEGVLFRPLPVDGKKLWASRDSVPGTLIWEPSFAQVSSSGDFGYTTGPWEFRPPANPDSAVAFGHFISVWRKQSDGAWRVAADIGIQHDRPERGVGSGDLALGAPLPAQKPGAKESPDVAALDRKLSDRTFVRGIGAAYAEAAAEDFLLNRDGFLPTRGIAPMAAAFDSLKGGLRFESRGAGVAASRDLAFSYGVTRWHSAKASAASDSGVYLHVWRREAANRWKLALAVENPL